MNTDNTIHGSMLVLLQQFVTANLGNTKWVKIHDEAGIDYIAYDRHINYPIAVFEALTRFAANEMNISTDAAKELFGRQLVPALLAIYGNHVNPEWKTYQLLQNTELVMHKAVRKQEHNANPPILNVSAVHDKLIIIDYYSKRKMACLAIGIIKGVAAYYNELESIQIIPTTNPDDERVQIRVEFT